MYTPALTRLKLVSCLRPDEGCGLEVGVFKATKTQKSQALRAYNPPDDRNTCSVRAGGWLYGPK